MKFSKHLTNDDKLKVKYVGLMTMTGTLLGCLMGLTLLPVYNVVSRVIDGVGEETTHGTMFIKMAAIPMLLMVYAVIFTIFNVVGKKIYQKKSKKLEEPLETGE